MHKHPQMSHTSAVVYFLEIRTRKKVSYVDAPLHKKTMNEHSNYGKEQKRKCHTHQDAFIHSFALYYTSSWKQEPQIGLNLGLYRPNLIAPVYYVGKKVRLLKVSRSRNKIVMPKLLPKNEQTNLFFYPEKQLPTRQKYSRLRQPLQKFSSLF